MTSIIIIDQSGNIKSVSIKNTDESGLYKKCGFKSINHFAKQASWDIVFNNHTLNIRLYAKTEGRVNSKNVYKFPILNTDNISFYGKCLLICYQLDESTHTYNCISMKADMWNNIYTRLISSSFSSNYNVTLTESLPIQSEHEHITLELKEEDYI